MSHFVSAFCLLQLLREFAAVGCRFGGRGQRKPAGVSLRLQVCNCYGFPLGCGNLKLTGASTGMLMPLLKNNHMLTINKPAPMPHHSSSAALALALAISLSLLSAQRAAAAVVNFQTDAGAVPDDNSLKTSWKNGGILNSTLAALRPGDTLLIPNATFHLMGGIVSSNLSDCAIQIDGTIVFSGDTLQWPRGADGKSVLECLQFNSPRNITLTSSGRGRIVGSGRTTLSCSARTAASADLADLLTAASASLADVLLQAPLGGVSDPSGI